MTIPKGDFQVKCSRLTIALLLLTAAALSGQAPGDAPYRNPSRTPERRAADLVSRMTLTAENRRWKSALAVDSPWVTPRM
jgi:hypothetical protein